MRFGSRSMLQRLGSTLAAGVLAVGCIPEPADQSDALLASLAGGIAANEQHACLVAGLNYFAGSGILTCMSAQGSVCEDALIADETARSAMLAAIDRVAATYPACAPAAVLAKQDVADLILPANHLLYAAGGTPGAHLAGSSYALERIPSCASVGLETVPFLAAGSTLASGPALVELSSAAGQVARADAGGSCRAALGSAAVSATQTLQQTLSMAAVCDYGTDDATLPDCPASLDRPTFRFGGITDW